MSNFRFIKLLLIFALISSCAGPSTQRISIDSEALDAETRLQKKLSLQKLKLGMKDFKSGLSNS